MKLAASVFVAAALVSATGPQSFAGWFAESAPILLVGAGLALTYSRFQFTGLTYFLLLLFSLVVFTGAHYTYARVPLGDWMARVAGVRRNHFDRIGHLFQGIAPALFFRELLRRRVGFPRGRALFGVVCGLCLGLAALFELLEWQYALLQHGPVAEDLGAQGDRWDAQADMLMALIGAAAAQAFLANRQDRQIAAVRSVA
jgi:putative membrane protein